MKIKKILILIAMLFAFPLGASADLGPKPTMDFAFQNFPQGIKIVEAQQIQCEDRSCILGNPLQDAGPQGFGCSEQLGCSSMAYGYAKFNKIVLKLSDGRKIESNVFSLGDLHSEYVITFVENENKMNVTLKDQKDSHEVTQTSPVNSPAPYHAKTNLQSDFWVSFFLTVVLEMLVGFIYLSMRKIKKTLLAWIFLANVISLPIFWYLNHLLLLSMMGYLIGEVLIVLFEAFFIKALLKEIGWKDALVLSFLMNAASFFGGNVLLAFLTF